MNPNAQNPTPSKSPLADSFDRLINKALVESFKRGLFVGLMAGFGTVIVALYFSRP